MNTRTPTSIIIPTYHEASNITSLIEKIADVDFKDRAIEVILVDDDSNDGIEAIVHSLTHSYPWLKLILRHGKKRCLSQSVLDGFATASHPLLIVMDADLSHSPSAIPDMLAHLEKPEVDMVIGSRYIKDGGTAIKWPWYRKIISHTCSKLAQLVIGTAIHDPLSGFFGIKQAVFSKADRLNPTGWKIGLELLAKCHCKHIVEVPIYFQERAAGKSKLTPKIAFAYLEHLIHLLIYKYAKTN